jgi:hypothetical protein
VTRVPRAGLPGHPPTVLHDTESSLNPGSIRGRQRTRGAQPHGGSVSEDGHGTARQLIPSDGHGARAAYPRFSRRPGLLRGVFRRRCSGKSYGRQWQPAFQASRRPEMDFKEQGATTAPRVRPRLRRGPQETTFLPLGMHKAPASISLRRWPVFPNGKPFG